MYRLKTINVAQMEEDHGKIFPWMKKDEDEESIIDDSSVDLEDDPYDSDYIEQNIARTSVRKSSFEDSEEDSEEEYFEEDDESDDEKKNIALQLEKEKYKKLLADMNLEGKLNWCNILEKTDLKNEKETVDDAEFPILNEIRAEKVKGVNGNQHIRIKFVPAPHIKVKIGEKTFIEFKTMFCKNTLAGGECKLGDKCIYSHQITKTKLCNSIRDNKICYFGDRCRYSHDLDLFKNVDKPNHNPAYNPNSKPNCKHGMKCLNPKCTFIHPTEFVKQGHILPSVQNEMKKHLLCKNNCKIENGEIKFIKDGCRFGDSCRYAHSRSELSENIDDKFKCKFGLKCKGIVTEMIKKADVTGKIRSVRRYKNSDGDRKCNKLHEKERITDFIIRTQSY